MNEELELTDEERARSLEFRADEILIDIAEDEPDPRVLFPM